MKKIFAFFVLLVSFIFATGVNAAQTTISSSPHWESFNITVYIPPEQPKTETMRHAFERWQRMTQNKLTFTFVEKQPAQISVNFTDKVNGNDGPIGICSLMTEGKYIKQAEISIATEGTQQYSDDLVFTTMLHEIGHALGLIDSTRKYRSIMHFPITEDQDILSIDLERLYKVNNWSWSQRNIDNN